MARALASRPETLRCELRGAEGGVRTFDFTLVPSLDPQQALRYVIVEGREVTAQLETERHQHRARRLELVGQLAGGVAHDFNNVLAAILSSSEMVKSELQATGALSPDVREGLDTISSAGMRAANLTRRLLTFARRAPLEKRVVSMHEVLGSTVKLLTRSLPPNVKLQTSFEAPRDTVEADPASVESMLLNLAINARDAMPEGGTLLLSTAELAPGGDQGALLRVSVCDTGSGIAPELLDRIFEPFFTTKPEGQGTGIGLASVFGAIRAHGGSVQVSSEVGVPEPGLLQQRAEVRLAPPTRAPFPLECLRFAAGCRARVAQQDAHVARLPVDLDAARFQREVHSVRTRDFAGRCTGQPLMDGAGRHLAERHEHAPAREQVVVHPAQRVARCGVARQQREALPGQEDRAVASRHVEALHLLFVEGDFEPELRGSPAAAREHVGRRVDAFDLVPALDQLEHRRAGPAPELEGRAASRVEERDVVVRSGRIPGERLVEIGDEPGVELSGVGRGLHPVRGSARAGSFMSRSIRPEASQTGPAYPFQERRRNSVELRNVLAHFKA